jgi:hypothetical protein
MKTDTPLLQIEDLHTVFYTDAGVVRAVNGNGSVLPAPWH